MCFGFVSFDSFSLFPNNKYLKYSVSMLFGGICSVLEEDSSPENYCHLLTHM